MAAQQTHNAKPPYKATGRPEAINPLARKGAPHQPLPNGAFVATRPERAVHDTGSSRKALAVPRMARSWH
jgi:hypothetical protein